MVAGQLQECGERAGGGSSAAGQGRLVHLEDDWLDGWVVEVGSVSRDVRTDPVAGWALLLFVVTSSRSAAEMDGVAVGFPSVPETNHTDDWK